MDCLVSKRKGVSPMGENKPQHLLGFGRIGQSFLKRDSILR